MPVTGENSVVSSGLTDGKRKKMRIRVRAGVMALAVIAVGAAGCGSSGGKTPDSAVSSSQPPSAVQGDLVRSTSASVAGPGYVYAKVTNRAAAGRQVTVKVQFTVPRGDERKLEVAHRGSSATRWTPVSLTGKQGVEASVIGGTYRMTLRKGDNAFRLRVTPNFRTTQNSQDIPVAMTLVDGRGKTLSKDALYLQLDLLNLTTPAASKAVLRRNGSWREATFTLANGSATSYHTVTVSTSLNCYEPNFSGCSKSSMKLQWFTGGRWRDVGAYASRPKPGEDADTVLTRLSVPVGASRQFRLRIAATTTARPGSTGGLEVNADSGAQGPGPWAFTGTSAQFTIG